MASIIVENCHNIQLQFVDSSVITSRTIRVIDCVGMYCIRIFLDSFLECDFVFEEVDVRKIECWNCTKCSVTYVESPTIMLNVSVIWREGCSNNFMQTGAHFCSVFS